MGNCSPKCTSVSSDNNSPTKYSSSIRVLTDSGTILELKGPKLASEVLNSHPGYGIFKQGHGSSPLAEDESLVGGKFYYLLPLRNNRGGVETNITTMEAEYIAAAAAEAKKRSLSHSASAEFVENLASGSGMRVLPSGGNGVWKVKLMIDTKQLEEILSEQGNTEALIERMRMVASSAAGTLTPRHSKRSTWKSNFSGLFNKVPDNSRRESPVSGFLHC